MSQENVEVVRRFVDQYGSATDMLRLVADFWEPEADYYPVRKFPEARPCHGVEDRSLPDRVPGCVGPLRDGDQEADPRER
jgi:hypothetical protein